MKHCHPSEFPLILSLRLSISLSFWYQSDIALANQLLLWSLSVRTPGDSRLPFYLPDYWVFSEKRVIIWLTVILILERENGREKDSESEREIVWVGRNVETLSLKLCTVFWWKLYLKKCLKWTTVNKVLVLEMQIRLKLSQPSQDS